MSVKTRLICTIVMFGLASLVSTNSTAQSVTCTYTSFEAANTGPGSGAYGINRFDATVGTWADTSFNAHGFYRSPQGKNSSLQHSQGRQHVPAGHKRSRHDRGLLSECF